MIYDKWSYAFFLQKKINQQKIAAHFVHVQDINLSIFCLLANWQVFVYFFYFLLSKIWLLYEKKHEWMACWKINSARTISDKAQKLKRSSLPQNVLDQSQPRYVCVIAAKNSEKSGDGVIQQSSLILKTYFLRRQHISLFSMISVCAHQSFPRSFLYSLLGRR